MLTSSTFQLLSNYSINLQELHLSNNKLVDLSPLHPKFPSLVILDLSNNDLSLTTLFQGAFMFNSKLEELYLSNCSLMDRSFTISSSASIINSSSSLSNLLLSFNLLTSSTIFHWVFNFTTNLHTLNLYSNLLEGSIPDNFGKVMNYLENLDLSNNKLQGPIPTFFGNSLEELDLSGNKLHGPIPTFFGNSLEKLDLSDNKLQGPIPTFFGNICTLHTLFLSNNNLSGDISSFIQNSSWCNRHIFQSLSLSYNRITGILPKSIGLLSELENLYLDGNFLEGEITESHLINLSKLKYLSLSYNSLSLKFDPGWVPPFQLILLGLASCKLGPNFPSWLYTQSHLIDLDISSNGIHASVPQWFWNNIQYVAWTLNMSHNNFIGEIPNIPLELSFKPYISLNSNQFVGVVPSFLGQASDLHLSENKFSNLSSLLCNNRIVSLTTLVVADNQIQGQLPDCWGHVNSLIFLDLSNNNLSGSIPPSMATLAILQVLVFRNNKLVGEVPPTLKNCTNLIVLDLSKNLFSGPIPSWMGESLQQLIILSMHGNQFSGNIPMDLCYLKRVQLLDLSRNNLSNEIPMCLKNFTAMSKSINSTNILNSIRSYYFSYFNKIRTFGYYAIIFSDYELNITLMWKGVEYWFKDPELRLNSIDLSSNHLTGEIPEELGYLIGLVSLNLSRNNLSGEIPSGIGNLTSLDLLDLSNNNLSGEIPSTISEIDDLGVLNLSYNSLSGRIPQGRHMQTYEASSFEGNPDLCGEQLNKPCPGGTTSPSPPQGLPTLANDDDNSIFFEALYMGLGLGFLAGFWAFLGPILIWRPWRIAYLMFLNKLTDAIYVYVAVNMAKCRRGAALWKEIIMAMAWCKCKDQDICLQYWTL